MIRAVIVFAALLAAQPVGALPITYEAALRTVSAGSNSTSTDQLGRWSGSRSYEQSEDDAGNWLFSSASQLSELGSEAISISGDVRGFSEGGGPHGSSSLIASFVAQHPLVFTATGSYWGSSVYRATVAFEVALLGSGGEIFGTSDSVSSTQVDDYISGLIDESGVLPAGEYTLEVRLYGSGSIFGGGSELALTFAPIPEPGSLALLGLGFVVVGLRRQLDRERSLTK